MNHIDRLSRSPAVVAGDYRTMSRVSLAQRAILSALTSEGVNLTEFHRSGLMLAMNELVGVLEERASFLEDQGFDDGGEV